MTAETATPLAIFDHWRDELTGGVSLGDELDDLRSRLAESQSALADVAEAAKKAMQSWLPIKGLGSEHTIIAIRMQELDAALARLNQPQEDSHA